MRPSLKKVKTKQGDLVEERIRDAPHRLGLKKNNKEWCDTNRSRLPESKFHNVAVERNVTHLFKCKCDHPQNMAEAHSWQFLAKRPH